MRGTAKPQGQSQTFRGGESNHQLLASNTMTALCSRFQHLHVFDSLLAGSRKSQGPSPLMTMSWLPNVLYHFCRQDNSMIG